MASSSPFNGSVRKRTEAPKALLCPISLSMPKSQKYKSIVDVMKVAERCDIVDVDAYCQECGSGEYDHQMLLCDKCNKGVHMFCVRPMLLRIPVGPWFCPKCIEKHKALSKSFKQTKIEDFFKIRKRVYVAERCASPQDAKKRRRHTLVHCKRRRRLLPFTTTKDDNQRLAQMGSLAAALTSLHIKFSNDLTYSSGMALRSANQASLEKGGMQVLAREDIETLELCRAMCKRGEWPPLLVVLDPIEGYTVEANDPIKDMTFLAEYTGDVDYISNRENDKCDSMMTLLSSTDPSQSLLICPDKRGNIARFINGINNHTLEGRKKQNVKCVRYNVNGESRVLLVAMRDINKGERLYYDYNGYEYTYPTHHFI